MLRYYGDDPIIVQMKLCRVKVDIFIQAFFAKSFIYPAEEIEITISSTYIANFMKKQMRL